MNMQTQYDLDTANIAERDNQRETVKVTIPIRDRNLLQELVRKFGWVCVFWEPYTINTEQAADYPIR